ncbi:hypothetical protein ACTXT7_010865 [Hymenolepis weldensis]
MPKLSACNKFYRPFDGPFVTNAIPNDATSNTEDFGDKRNVSFEVHSNRPKPCVVSINPGATKKKWNRDVFISVSNNNVSGAILIRSFSTLCTVYRKKVFPTNKRHFANALPD